MKHKVATFGTLMFYTGQGAVFAMEYERYGVSTKTVFKFTLFNSGARTFIQNKSYKTKQNNHIMDWGGYCVVLRSVVRRRDGLSS